jgi:hypothetical protein
MEIDYKYFDKYIIRIPTYPLALLKEIVDDESLMRVTKSFFLKMLLKEQPSI